MEDEEASRRKTSSSLTLRQRSFRKKTGLPVKRKRNGAELKHVLRNLAEAIDRKENLMPTIIHAVKPVCQSWRDLRCHEREMG